MKTTLLVLSGVCILFSALTNVASLQCYQCSSCTKVEEDYLVTCGSNATSSTTTTTTTLAPNATTTAPNVTTTVAPPHNTTNGTSAALAHKASRVKRAAGENKNCVCQNENCDCSGQYFMQSRAYTNITTITYVCVKDTYIVNGLSFVKRGCAVKYNETQTTCSTASFEENCSICEKDKCNGSVTFRYSAVVLFLCMLFYVF